MKKEYLIAVIAVCAVILVGMKVTEMYEKHQREVAYQKRKEERDRKMHEDYKRAMEWIKGL